jgi:hydroxymethylbilane synthase
VTQSSNSSNSPIVYATRKSKLALSQSRAFIERLRAFAEKPIEELQVVTSGDRIVDRPLYEVGGKGLFVKEIEEALMEGKAHLAVHSIKDVPGTLPPCLAITCIPQREDPRDAFISPKYASLSALPKGARVGTSSLRRKVALLHLRPDLQILPLRGNVDTRLQRVDDGAFDAIVLAAAGLRRLQLEARVTELLAPEQMLPAVGQGALGIETRTPTDAALSKALDQVACAETTARVTAERAFLQAFGGDCRSPLAAYATLEAGNLHLRAWIAGPDGENYRASEQRGPKADAARLGEELAKSLGAAG